MRNLVIWRTTWILLLFPVAYARTHAWKRQYTYIHIIIMSAACIYGIWTWTYYCISFCNIYKQRISYYYKLSIILILESNMKNYVFFIAIDLSSDKATITVSRLSFERDPVKWLKRASHKIYWRWYTWFQP